MVTNFIRLTPIEVGGKALPVITRSRIDPYAWTLLPTGAVYRIPKLTLWLAPERAISHHIATHTMPTPELYPVTVVPDMHCNARCPYCVNNVLVSEDGDVQRVPNSVMTPPVIEATAAFIERQRIAKGLPGVSLMLFGGEPLVSPERTYNLLDAIQHVETAQIVTNGTYLTLAVARKLAARRVVEAQITFDGDREQHDNTRILANGNGTYDTIVANLQALDRHPELFPSRQLRVNVSASNIDGLDSLLRDLAAKLNPANYWLYFNPVMDISIGWQGGGLRLNEHADRFNALTRLARELGFLTGTGATTFEFYCYYCSGEFGDGGAVIGPEGLLYSCWYDVGHTDRNLGNVWRGYQRRGPWRHCGDGAVNQIQGASNNLLGEDAWFQLEHLARLSLQDSSFRRSRPARP